MANTQLKVSTLKSFNVAIRDTRTQEYLMQVLGTKKSEFVANLISVVSGNEALQKCEPMSLVFTAMKATALNLPIEPSLGKAAIIPFNDTKAGVVKAQFQVMRDGWVELLQRSGQVQFIANEPVHEGELVKTFELGAGESYHLSPSNIPTISKDTLYKHIIKETKR